MTDFAVDVSENGETRPRMTLDRTVKPTNWTMAMAQVHGGIMRIQMHLG